jgi:hypothetical protein
MAHEVEEQSSKRSSNKKQKFTRLEPGYENQISDFTVLPPN